MMNNAKMRKEFFGAVELILLFLLSGNGLCEDVFDSFNRQDSNIVGQVEKGNYKWIEIGDNENNDLIRIVGGKLSFHYFLSEPKPPYSSLACNLDGFKTKNMDVSVTITTPPKYGFASGISYRMDTQEGLGSAPGYHVFLNTKASPKTITLKYGNSVIVTKEVDCEKTSSLRVVVSGTSHKVYLDGKCVIDIQDDEYTEEGCVGLFSYYDIPAFDDFSVTVLPEVAEVKEIERKIVPKILKFTIEKLYPQGKKFPFGAFSVSSKEDVVEAKKDGFNLIHTYSMTQSEKFVQEWLEQAAKNNLFVTFSIEEKLREGQKFNEDSKLIKKTKYWVETFKGYENIAWWNLPEEQRYWREDEYKMINEYSKYLRESDPLKRPVYMYIPTHYAAEAIEHYINILDIIGAGAYTEYANKPRVWIYWRINQEVIAIEKSGFAGKCIPIAVLPLFDQKGKVNTFDDAYHDVYASIVSGAKGILIFSFYYRKQFPDAYRAYQKALQELSDTAPLGQVVLFGEKYEGIQAKVLSGLEKLPKFIANFDAKKPEEIELPSVNFKALAYRNELWIIAVNSADEKVEVAFSGFPGGQNEIELPFENRTTKVINSQITETFLPLGVHIYKVRLK